MTSTNVEFISRTAEVSTVVVKTPYDLGFVSGLSGSIRLEVELHATDCGESQCAVHAAVTASFPYEKAIDKDARVYHPTDISPAGSAYAPTSVGRPATVLLWGPAHVMASGSLGAELVQLVARAIEQPLKKFYVDFLDANPRD